MALHALGRFASSRNRQMSTPSHGRPYFVLIRKVAKRRHLHLPLAPQAITHSNHVRKSITSFRNCHEFSFVDRGPSLIPFIAGPDDGQHVRRRGNAPRTGDVPRADQANAINDGKIWEQ